MGSLTEVTSDIALLPTGHDVLDALRSLPRPFTTAEALHAGATYPLLRRWAGCAMLAHPVRGVYHSPALAEDLALRIAALKLLVPDDCVVTDRTAGWLWGANMILAPNDHLVVPKVSVFAPPGRRLRSDLVASGERRLQPTDISDVEGLQVTTPLRTACDLGRLLHLDQALAAMDALARLRTFSMPELTMTSIRYAGYRGVVQLRALVPLVDPDAESPAESILRLRWIEIGLPRPRCQVPVTSPSGAIWRLDMGLEESRFAAEYDGEEFHGADQAEHDEARRVWLCRSEGWRIVVVRKRNLFGRDRDAEHLLRTAATRAGLLK